MCLVGLEKLGWRLAVVVALGFVGGFEGRVVDETHIEITFFLGSIRDLAERVKRHHCFLIALLAPKDIVDPSVEVVRHILRLNALTHHLHEFKGILVSPRRQHDVVDFCAVLLFAEIAAVMVYEHFRQEVELWGQLSHVREVSESIHKGLVQREEHALWIVEGAPMQLNVRLKVRC